MEGAHALPDPVDNSSKSGEKKKKKKKKESTSKRVGERERMHEWKYYT